MSVSAVAPTPFYQDPDRLPIGLPQASSAGKADAAANGDGKHLSMFAAGDEEPSFWDLLDVINPLQHIPVVSNIYRELTGDQIGVGARLVGGALFGGPIGLIASAVNCVVEESSGKDMGGHMLALFRDEGESSPGTTQFAHTPASNTQAANAAAAVPAVSSSPAGAVAAASNGTSQAGAPVISLPEISAGPAASQPMVFSLDGMQAAGAPSPAPAPAPVTVAAMDAAQPATAAQPAAKPMPLLAGAARTMPAPPRNLNAGTGAPLPQVTVPVSNSGSRSNMPITGRSPQAAMNAAAAQRAVAGQGNLSGHPMLPPTDANGQTAASPDWFTTAWGQALDKYQRANQRNDKAATGAATSTLQ